ncbi:MAG: hypothetical protein K0S68_455 [Candidatus Saccharibacteria bacterium]|nr:hypothetical protein [Candidatus Saccharibacteria bacterium]
MPLSDRAAKAQEHLRAAAQFIGTPINRLDIYCDEQDGTEMLLRSAKQAKRLIGALQALGYVWNATAPGLRLPSVHLLKFNRMGGPELEYMGLQLPSAVTVVIVLDEPVQFQVWLPGEGRQMEVSSTHASYPEAYAEVERKLDEGVDVWAIGPDLFPAQAVRESQ